MAYAHSVTWVLSAFFGVDVSLITGRSVLFQRLVETV
jgi:hypothetical protein